MFSSQRRHRPLVVIPCRDFEKKVRKSDDSIARCQAVSFQKKLLFHRIALKL